MTKHYFRRDFMKLSGLFTVAIAVGGCSSSALFASKPKNRPNIILCMCDDLGWGDIGYHDTT